MSKPYPAPRGDPSRLFVSVGTKMGATALLVMAALTVVVYGSLSHFEHEKMIGAKEQAARMASQLFMRSVAVPVVFDDETGISDTVKLLARDPEVVGVELWRVRQNRTLGGKLATQLRDTSESGAEARYSDGVAVERRADRMILRDSVRDPDGKVIAVAAVQFSLLRENRDYTDLRRRILVVAAGVALLISLLLGAITRRSILRPLGRLLAAVQQVEAGESFETATGAPNDELGRLARAFGRMAEVVSRRERDIARRNQDMKRVLDNVGQGFLALDAHGHLGPERSAIVDRWFGAPLPGEPIGAYLGRIDAVAAGMLTIGLEALVDGFMPIELVLDQLPRRLTREGRHYACEYQPVYDGELLRQLVMVVSDITSAVECDRAESAQKDLIAAVSRMMSDRIGFLDFVREAGDLVSRIVAAGDQTDRAVFLREVHTLKGSCAIFGLRSISAQCHLLEDQARDTQALPAPEARADLERMWGVLLQQISLFGGTRRTHIELSPQEYDGLLNAVRRRAPYEDLAATLAQLGDEPVRPRLELLGEHAVTLAQRLGRCEVEIDLDDTTLRLPHEPWNALWPTLAHVVRNSVDHGLETTEERERAGKAPAAKLTLSAWSEDGVHSIVIADDGRGIDWDRLRDKARELGLPANTRHDSVAALFADGVSTRAQVSETSGRGVGLAALRQAVEHLGGVIHVSSAIGRGTRFQLDFPTASARSESRLARVRRRSQG